MNTRILRTAGLTAMALAASLVLAAPVGAAPGNNGTVKIDGEVFDDLPNNEPHVGCSFQVDFYGFDEGDDLFAHVTFTAQPPSGRGIILEDDVFIGEDDASGGGSEAGLDASATFTLDLSALDEHPVQGYHVKLTVEADGSKGADTKHKTFWVTGCEPPCEEPPTDPEWPNQET